jgi:hypothetical protein
MLTQLREREADDDVRERLEAVNDVLFRLIVERAHRGSVRAAISRMP